MKSKRWKTTKEDREQQVARERSSGEEDDLAHNSLDFDPAAVAAVSGVRVGCFEVALTDAPAEET